MGQQRILVLGGGFAGAYFAQAAERTLRGLGADVVLLDRSNYFSFSPLLVEAGTGGLEPRHAVVSIRSFLRTTTFHMAEVTGVDAERQEVSYRAAGSGETLKMRYDHLVLALGAVTRRPAIPGLCEHGCTMKSLTDAVALRDRAIRMLEAADLCGDAARRRALLHFVVVGGNFTGVEVAGEFQAFLRAAAAKRYPMVRPEECAVTLIEITERILPALGDDLSSFALLHLRRRGIDVRLRSSVRAITADEVVLEDGERIAARTVIWCAGIAPPPLYSSLPFPRDERGYILCEADLRVRGFENVWGIGDGAVNPDPQGRAYPATAQHAVRQGRHLAKNLARALRGEQPTPCVIRSVGSLAAFGCRTGVAKVLGIKLSGFAAWAMWRTVYLLKMPGWARRMRVALDWTMDLFFPRDYVELGIHRPSSAAEDDAG